MSESAHPAEMVERELVCYPVHSSISTFEPLLDDENQCYSLIIVVSDRSLGVPV